MAIPIAAAIAVGAGAQIVSGLMQYYQSEKSRKATDRRLKEIEEMFNKIVPPEFDLKIYDDPRLVGDIPLPSLNLQAITPQEFRRVGQFVPEVADFVKEKNPELVKASQVATEGRQAQLEALQRFRAQAAGEFDPELAQMLSEASDRAQTQAQSRQASILQDAQRRGQLGSGMMMASQMQGGADAMRTAALESQRAAAEAYRNRQMAAARAADLGGNIRASEMNEEARNVGIINDFNQRTSRAAQEWAQYVADTRNRGQMYNLDEAQKIANANVAAANDFAWRNRTMQNQGEATLFDARRAQRGDLLDVARDKRSAQQQMYDNALRRAAGAAGIQQNFIENDRMGTRDRNQVVQGIGDAVSKGVLMGSMYAQPQVQPEAPGAAGRGTAVGRGYAPMTPRAAGDPNWLDNNQSRQSMQPYDREWTFDDWMASGGRR